jgi:hypothetical protein
MGVSGAGRPRGRYCASEANILQTLTMSCRACCGFCKIDAQRVAIFCCCSYGMLAKAPSTADVPNDAPDDDDELPVDGPELAGAAASLTPRLAVAATPTVPVVLATPGALSPVPTLVASVAARPTVPVLKAAGLTPVALAAFTLAVAGLGDTARSAVALTLAVVPTPALVPVPTPAATPLLPVPTPTPRPAAMALWCRVLSAARTRACAALL